MRGRRGGLQHPGQLLALDSGAGGSGGGRGRGPAGKRRRADGGGADAAARQGPWKLELHLFMQHAGLFLLTAALHKSAPDGALAWFGAQARALHQALAARWKVQA